MAGRQGVGGRRERVGKMEVRRSKKEEKEEGSRRIGREKGKRRRR
jgi:hypothetical protein